MHCGHVLLFSLLAAASVGCGGGRHVAAASARGPLVDLAEVDVEKPEPPPADARTSVAWAVRAPRNEGVGESEAPPARRRVRLRAHVGVVPR